MYGRIRMLPDVLHILGLAKNLIYVRKTDNAEVKIVFEKETRRMVQGEMVLLKGVQIGTMYKIHGNTISDGFNGSIILDIGAQEGKTPTVFGENTMLWHERLGNIEEKGLQLLHDKGMVERMSNFSLYFYLCEHCVYGKHNRVRFLFGASRAEGIL
jgi:hypothetical protein